MIIDNQLTVNVTDVLSEDNSLIRLNPQHSLLPLKRIAMVTFSSNIYGQLSLDVKKKCLSHCLRFISNYLPRHSFWLLISNAGWQPDNRITKYLGLWKSLKKRGVDLSENEKTNVVEIRRSNELKYFGAVKVTESDAVKILQIISKENLSFLISTGSSHPPDLNIFLRYGWATIKHRDNEFYTKVISAVCSSGYCFLRFFGEFDDPETGVSILFDKDSTAGCLRHVNFKGSMG